SAAPVAGGTVTVTAPLSQDNLQGRGYLYTDDKTQQGNEIDLVSGPSPESAVAKVSCFAAGQRLHFLLWQIYLITNTANYSAYSMAPGHTHYLVEEHHGSSTLYNLTAPQVVTFSEVVAPNTDPNKCVMP